jgi:hypothetical protein
MANHRWRHCTIHADDDIIDIPDGLVIVNGGDATIYEYRNGRAEQADRLTGAEIKTERDGAIVLVGNSTHLMREVRVPPEQARIGMRITPKKGCKGCR